jgi:hypothetical protein
MTQAELEAIASEPLEPRGILHSEMALIIGASRDLGIEVFVESGRARGQSTYMLAKYLPNVTVHSIEANTKHPDEAFARERLRGFLNVNLYSGDGAQGCIAFCADARPKRTAVLCDGPKGLNAIATVKLCFRFAHVLAGFMHDMREPETRAAASVMLPTEGARFSDDPAWSVYSWMDGKVGDAYQEMFGSRGPTVGMFLNNKKAA